MSFILDALKKSETDRQQQGSAEFAGVPTSRDVARVPRWLWILGLLLAVNLAVLLSLLLRPAAAPAIRDIPVSAAGTPAGVANPLPVQNASPAAAEQSFAAQVAAAKQNVRTRQQPAAGAREMPQASLEDLPGASRDVAPGVVYSPAPRNSASLPTLQEVRANGAVVLPELHLDIHVYSDVPTDRFVFINMSKQHENSRLSEGPLVKEIAPEGVVLEYEGTTFLLPRD